MIYAGYTPKKSSDEQYTPAYAVAPIIKYIPGNKIVWCPFDTEHSEYVLALKAAGIGKERCLFRIKLLLLGSPPKTDCV